MTDGIITLERYIYIKEKNAFIIQDEIHIQFGNRKTEVHTKNFARNVQRKFVLRLEQFQCSYRVKWLNIVGQPSDEIC